KLNQSNLPQKLAVLAPTGMGTSSGGPSLSQGLFNMLPDIITNTVTRHNKSPLPLTMPSPAEGKSAREAPPPGEVGGSQKETPIRYGGRELVGHRIRIRYSGRELVGHRIRYIGRELVGHRIRIRYIGRELVGHRIRYSGRGGGARGDFRLSELLMESYEETLKVHHTWLQQNLFMLAIRSCQATRNSFLKAFAAQCQIDRSIRGPDWEILQQLQAVADSAEPVVQLIQRELLSRNCI
ncbi:unnamed protein product, partial [Cyprideis torosa]